MTDATIAVRSPERRLSHDRHSWEFLFETMFRPGNWAAKASYSLGLQGRLRSTTMTVTTARAALFPNRPQLRIAFASDFHAGGMTDNRRLAEACEALADMTPDVLLLGGDFVSVRGADVHRIAPLLADIPAPLGKFAVLGNHDLRANHGLIVSGLERAGVRMIANDHVRLDGPFSDISICGLDDATYGAPRADLAFSGATETRIVLMHSPEGLASIGDREFDLALCGHTHGGQIRAPWGEPLIIPGGPLNRRYFGGSYEVGGESRRALLVSHGVGCSSVPVRLFAAPEVHLCLVS